MRITTGHVRGDVPRFSSSEGDGTLGPAFADCVARRLPAPTISSTVSLAPPEAMLLSASSERSADRNRRARVRADRLLDLLCRLQRSLLGEVDEHALAEMKEVLVGEAAPLDPCLAALVAALELRARVEVARRDR